MTFVCPCCHQLIETPTLEVALSGVELTPQEKEILALLWRRRGRPVSVSSIVHQVWQLRDRPLAPHNIVSIYIHKLRKKVPYHIQLHTDLGIGYRLELVQQPERSAA